MHRFRSARENNATGCKGFDIAIGGVPGHNLAVHPYLADTSRNQLGVLGTKIQNEQSIAVNILCHARNHVPIGVNAKEKAVLPDRIIGRFLGNRYIVDMRFRHTR